jgi:hypothetical protein
MYVEPLQRFQLCQRRRIGTNSLIQCRFSFTSLTTISFSQTCHTDTEFNAIFCNVRFVCQTFQQFQIDNSKKFYSSHHAINGRNHHELDGLEAAIRAALRSCLRFKPLAC